MLQRRKHIGLEHVSTGVLGAKAALFRTAKSFVVAYLVQASASTSTGRCEPRRFLTSIFHLLPVAGATYANRCPFQLFPLLVGLLVAAHYLHDWLQTAAEIPRFPPSCHVITTQGTAGSGVPLARVIGTAVGKLRSIQ